MATMRPILSVLLLVLLATLAAPADAVKARQRGKLDQVQAAWASAVRWSEFESAWELVDPARRAQGRHRRHHGGLAGRRGPVGLRRQRR